MFSVVIWLLLQSVGSQYQTGIMGKGINAKNPRICPFSFLLHFCLPYASLPFGKKSDCEQETCFMRFMEANAAKCHWLH